jgi:glycosyltransferase involved in cell wall biosynthesis
MKSNIDVSVIIPSYKDKFLHNTVADILNNFTSNFEIIPVIDGYKLKHPLIEHSRVKPLVLRENVGMRNAINAGVQVSTGKYLIRSDEHCMFAPGFDSDMISRIQPDWIMTAVRYALDPIKWEVIKDNPPVIYEKLGFKVVDGKKLKFAGVAWRSRDRKRRHIDVDESMAMQGSCWTMHRSWWDKVIQNLQTEGYGPHYQDSVEMLFKTWRAGGKLMINKNTWYAHKGRMFGRTHRYPGDRARVEWKYVMDKWGKDYREMRRRWHKKVMEENSGR